MSCLCRFVSAENLPIPVGVCLCGSARMSCVGSPRIFVSAGVVVSRAVEIHASSSSVNCCSDLVFASVSHEVVAASVGLVLAFFLS